MGGDQQQLEEHSILTFNATTAPPWAQAQLSAVGGDCLTVSVVKMQAPQRGTSEPTMNGALLLFHSDALPPYREQDLKNLASFVGRALNIAISENCIRLTDLVMSQVFESRDLNSGLHRVATMVRGEFSVEGATVWLLDEPSSLVRIGGTTGLKDHALRVRQVFYAQHEPAIVAEMIRTNSRNPRFLDDVSWDDDWYKTERYVEATSSPVRSVLYVPIIVKPARSAQRVVGVLRCVNRFVQRPLGTRGIAFTAEDITWARHVCDLLALIVHSTAKAHSLLHTYEMVMHGSKTALAGISDNLNSLISEKGVIDRIPKDVRYALPDSLSFVDDLKWQIARTELWEKPATDIEPKSVLLGSVVLPKVKELAELMMAVHDVDKLHFDYSDIKDLPAVRGDPHALLAVFRNLVENSMKYTAGRECRIHIALRADSQFVYASIIDNGIGIPESDAPFVFWMGYRGDLAMSHQPKGAGIGLSWSKRVVEDMGGTLTLQSGRKEGSEFVLALARWSSTE
jgi:hypothetical protein